MKVSQIKIFIICLFAIIGGSASAMKLNLSVDLLGKQSIEVGDHFLINYTLVFEQSELPPGVPNVPAPKKVKGCKIVSFDFANSSQNISTIRGKRTVTYQFMYSLVLEAEKKGEYTYGPVEIYGVKSNEVSYEIATKQTEEENQTESTISLGYGTDEIFLEATLSKPEVYTGMSTEYVVKLYHQVNGLDSYERISDADLKNFEFDESPKVPEYLPTEVVNGIEYTVVVLDKIYLTPQKTGRLKIKGGEYRFTVNRVEYVEDPFWGMIQVAKPTYVDVKVPEVDLAVKKFPKKQPDNYLGAIGQFSITTKLSTTAAHVGQVVSLTYSVSGTGNITDIKLPEIENQYSALSISEPYITHREQTIDGNVVGVTRFEYTITASEGGEYEIAPLELVFFNPETGDFETAVARGLSLEVQDEEPEAPDNGNYEIF